MLLFGELPNKRQMESFLEILSSLPELTAFSHVWMVPSGIPNSLAALAPPISLASFTACTLYSWSYLRATLNTSLFSWFYYEILEYKVSTFLYHTPNRWQQYLKAGDKVFVSVESYKSNGSDRQDCFMGYYIVEHPDGTRDYESFSFQNESSQTQEQWNKELETIDVY